MKMVLGISAKLEPPEEKKGLQITCSWLVNEVPEIVSVKPARGYKGVIAGCTK
jgi:hypothetical protein